MATKIMNTWIPLWSQVVDSTLWEEPLEVRVLFLTMLAIKDPDHVVRMPFRRLCKKANMEAEACQSALNVLLAPDSRSLDKQDHQGRRVEAVPEGWLILNGEHYRSEMSKLMRRLYKNDWQRKNRQDKQKKGVARSGSTSNERLFGQKEANGDLQGAEDVASAGLPEASLVEDQPWPEPGPTEPSLPRLAAP